MKNLKYKLKYFWYTTDSIEMVLFASIFGFLGWMGWHAVVGIIERFI